jgi:hypothetical protein
MEYRIEAKSAMLVMAGIIVGLVMGFWPQSPLHAVATDRQDNFAMATGAYDTGVEAVFTLDFLTGDLSGAVVNPTTRDFSATFRRNVMKDLKVETGKTPKYMLVTGDIFVRTGSNFRLAPTAVYVAELTSGNMAVYGFPWSPVALTRPESLPQQDFVLIQVFPFRNAAIR